MVLYALGVLAFGILRLQTSGDMFIIGLAVVSAPVAGLFAWEHQRQHRRAQTGRRVRAKSAVADQPTAPRPSSDTAGGLITYPTPRTVWIMGSRPASIFLRR
jgi:hypothetical protein